MLNKFKSVSTFAVISIIILLFSIASLVAYDPQNNFSENENRVLQTLPTPTWETLVDGKFATQYEDFISDYFWLRDDWISAKSVVEYAQLKTENNDVVYGADGYLFPKFYTFDADRLQANLDAIDLFAFHSVSDVSVIVVPTAAYPLADKLPAGLPVVDEAFYINEINRYLSGTATPLNVASTLVANNNKYIYFRTDHHWTTYGAWLGYSQFAAANGLPAFDYNRLPAIAVEGFLGTNYSKAKNFNVVPDTIEYFEFPATMQVFTGQNNQYVESYDSLYDHAKFSQRDKYGAFLHGNNGYSVITSEPGAKKLDNVLVICDSYGYNFVPFLTENYSSVTVVDVRYYLGDYSALRETYYDDVIVLYGFKSLTEYRLEPLNTPKPADV